MAAELTDDIRVPLDSLHADALYLASRVAQGTMSAVRLSQVIRERIDAAKAALATQQAAQGAEPECFGLRFPSDQKLCLSTIFDTEEEAKDYCDQCSPGTVVVPLYTAPPPTAEVEKKAARYDWLRALPLFGAWDVTRVRPSREWLIDSLRADELDAAIDAALSKESANGLE